METQVIANSAPSTKSELSAISSYCCQTKGLVNEIDFEWTIERSAFFGDLGIWETFKSAEFSDCKFFLTLDMTSHSSIVTLYLDRHSNSSNYPIRVEFDIFNEKYEAICEKTATIGISKGTVRSILIQMSKKDLIESRHFKNGNIIISCKIKSMIRTQQAGKVAATERHLHKTPIRDDDQDFILYQLEESFEKMALSDVTFNVRGRQFSAHKAILGMRSEVFAAMFQHPTKELISGQVEVEDVDPDVFQEVIRYLYTGWPQSTALDVMAPALLAAADKYLLDKLKTRCETHLIRQMSSQNCLDLLALTITHHPAEHLKKFAIEYFRRYPNEVMGTDNWKKLKEENPALLCDLQQMVLTAPTV